MKPIQILELFGGIGAPRCALRNLGIPVKSIDYVEIDEKAVRSYNAMFKEDMHQKPQDVRGWNLRPDILVHGSPCQDFSIAGHQKGANEGNKTRSSLMWETIHIIENMGVWKPRIVIWENVKNVLSKHMKHNFERYLKEMERLGYKNSYAILDARDFGLPQKRQRVFTISILGGPAFDFSRLKYHPMRPLKEFIDERYENCHVVTQESVLSCIGKKGIRRAKVIDDCANTITTRQDRTPAQVVEVMPDLFRYLTEKECWKLMGFSEGDFEAAKKANDVPDGKMNRTLYKQAGNSMPVPVLEEIFRNLKL